MKIGITLDFSSSFWANGLQQNVVFLYETLSRAGNECYYLFDKEPPHSLGDNHLGMSIWDVLDDKSEKFDALILIGFDLHKEMYEQFMFRNQDTKIIMVHYGNKLFNDMHYSVGPASDNKTAVTPPAFVSQIWTSPHYESAIPYYKTYYNTEEVYTCPYIWDSSFVQGEAKVLSQKGLDPFFNPERINKVCIFEPNITISKNCIVPFMIMQEFDYKFPNELSTGSIFCCDKLRKKPFFMDYVNKFPITKKDSFIYFNNRHGMLDAVSKFGNTIVSHQIENELNYLYFEALYLGLPLIHNSEALSDFGYYYPKNDIQMAAKQVKNAFLNHEEQLNSYKGDVQRLFQKHSPYNASNINGYMSLLETAKPAR